MYLTYCCYVFRQLQARISTQAQQKLSAVNFAAKSYIPTEFNRKLRPVAELAYWKATEFRFFLIYGGFAFLRNEDVLSRERYEHYLKFAVLMCSLLFDCQYLEPLEIQQLVKEFASEAIGLYGKQFMSYNVHSLIHLIDDFLNHGSLEQMSSFPFESYLGIVKNSVRSGFKPFEQAANKCHTENDKLITQKVDTNNMITISSSKTPGILPPYLERTSNIIHYNKIQLTPSKCKLSVNSKADSTVFYDNNLYMVQNIVKIEMKMFFVAKKFKKIKNLFSHPVLSSSVGIYSTKNKFCDVCLIPVQHCIKCVNLPYKKKFILCTYVHKIFK